MNSESSEENPEACLTICECQSVAGCAAALREAFDSHDSAVLLLDSGVTMSEGCVEAISRAQLDLPDAVFGCRTADIDWPQHLQMPGWRWSLHERAWQPEWVVELRACPQMPRYIEVNWLSPESLLVPRTAWQTVGEFDWRLSKPLAVIDWCVRARKAGFSVIEIQDAVVFIPASPVLDRVARENKKIQRIPDMLRLADTIHLPCKKIYLAINLFFSVWSVEFNRIFLEKKNNSSIGAIKVIYWRCRKIVYSMMRGNLYRVTHSILMNYFEKTSRRNG
ncbi:MAG: hypothetical protein QFE16_00170 [Pseudomonadota bacterium]|nr:hypothetical protein [Pseudomonadota bacterium]